MTPSPALMIVGRVRKAHGIRGELLVEPITDAPDAVFVSGRRLFAGTATGDPSPDGQALHITAVRQHMDSVRLTLREVPDRSAAELWRGRFLLVPQDELPPPADDEVYLHDLIGMQVRHADGRALGEIADTYDLPQGLMLDVRPVNGGPTYFIPWREEILVDVDEVARVVTVRPPEGLLPDELPLAEGHPSDEA
ncbi:MAG: 16S rRNA processing protein RimM [Gemmatimonadaceae bacterium]|nr:16S rRNA processing protein RimM [Gemmatimonadaceae bacterium]